MNPSSSQTSGSWSAVLSITACVAGLITVEFLPAGLLTPMAEGLQISQGMAGQTLTATAFAAIFASLFASRATRGVDRRKVILGYSLLLILSCLLTAFSTRFAVLLVGRVLLGLALGGFWAMAAAITMQLVPAKDVPKALSIVFGGVSVAL
ncbi:MAG: MFS transporter, partial [Sinobacteraceae bacterium]|nr:MFS transporter [Nevskiaceae bacterium]